jgi:hypothetical protein
MNGPDGFDRLITTWLDELAPMREPDGLLEAVTGQIQRTRRSPSWALLERWLPMQTRAKFGAIPRTAIILVTLGILALILTAVAIGAQPSTRSELAPLFGLAGNGRVFSNVDGDLYVAEPGSEVPQPFVTSPRTELYQTMTNDGSHVVYQVNDGDTSALMIAAADGTGEPRQLGGEPATLGDWWPSPDGTLVAMTPPGDAPEDIIIVPANGDEPWTLPIGTKIMTFVWENDGQHLLVITDANQPGVDTQRGAEIHRVATAGGPVTPVSYLPGGIRWLNLAPDGRRMSYATLDEPCCDQGGVMQAWVANVDGTDARRVTDSVGDIWEDSAFWSPDGTRVAMSTGYGAEFRVAIVAVDEDGPSVLSDPITLSRPIDRSSDVNNLESIRVEWAPDGTSLLLWRDADPEVMSINATTGETTTLPWTSTDWPVWQRVAQ